MKAPPLLSEHPRSVQLVLAVVAPAAFGALTGYFLGVSAPVYIAMSLVGVVGGIGAGFDHLGAKVGAQRGVLGGFLFGASILLAHEIHGAVAEAHLPEPAVVLVVVTTILGAGFGAIGGKLRARSLLGHESTEPVPDPAESAEPQEPQEPLTPAVPANSPHSPLAPNPGPTQPAPAPASPKPPTPRTDAEGPVNLNSGTVEDYRSIGMSLTQAKRVVDYRERFGSYSDVDQLDQVPGFSKVTLIEIKPRLTV